MTRDLKQLSNTRRHQSRKRKQISKTVSGDSLMSDSPVEEDDLGETPPSCHKKVRWDSHATSETHDNLEMESETGQSVVIEKVYRPTDNLCLSLT